MKFPVRAAVLVAALVAPGCDVKVGEGGLSVDMAHGRASDEWVRSYDLSRGGELEILNVNGEIVVSPAEGLQVEVRAQREARANSDEGARALLDKLEIFEDAAPGRVRVETRAQEGGSGLFQRGRVTVRYTVRVPAGLRTHFRTENGGVRLNGVDGTIRVETTNGGINGRDVTGGVTATTVNGGVQIALKAVTGDVEVSSVNGGVRLELPADADGQLEASAVNGGVTVDTALKFTAVENERRRVAGRLNRGGPRITAHTTNGGVRVSALGAFAAAAADGSDGR